jgi:hypothetical protein
MVLRSNIKLYKLYVELKSLYIHRLILHLNNIRYLKIVAFSHVKRHDNFMDEIERTYSNQ